MSETKFTKGPWVSIKRRYDSSFAVETENTGFSICTTVSNEEIDEHNARLIAAAPEMYEMLSDLANDYSCQCGHPRCSKESQKREIQDLLAKARGEL